MPFGWLWQKPRSELYSSLEDIDSERDGPFISEKNERPLLLSRPRNLYSVLGLFAIALFGALFRIHFEIVSRPPTAPRLVKSPVPELPLEVKTFERDPLYFKRLSAESDAAWIALAGPPRDHQGFIFVEHFEAYGMEPGAFDEGKVIYGVSMFHQLHCLREIRETLWNVVDGNVDVAELLSLTPNDTSRDFESTNHGFWHVQHCFDYLRQSIQCAGDMSLEWPVRVEGKSLFVGWNNPHTCKQWDAAWKYVDENS